MEQILADTEKAVAEMNRIVSPGEQTRDFYRKQGTQAEQERIIKLLVEMPTKAIKTEHGTQILSLELKDIIALIKGEK